MNETRQIIGVVFSLGFEETFFLSLFSGKREKRELDNKRIPFGIVILTKQICYYLLLLVNRYFLTNDYYSLISIMWLVSVLPIRTY